MSLSIAAASIIAKVTRDRLMVGAGLRMPGLWLGANKGYGTACCTGAALARPSGGYRRTIRRSFAPVRERYVCGRLSLFGNTPVVVGRRVPGLNP